MGEHHAGSVGVTGSSPVGSTSIRILSGDLRLRNGLRYDHPPGKPDPSGSPVDLLRHHMPRIVVCVAVVALLAGGAFYSSRVSAQLSFALVDYERHVPKPKV